MTGRSHSMELVYFNAGGGHRAAAHALEQLIVQQGRPWRVRKIDLFKVLDPADRFRRTLGFRPETYYNQRLAKGWTRGLAQELRLLQWLIRRGHPAMVGRLQSHWSASRPDLVVSLVPNFNRALGESLARALPGVPLVTVLTDLADHPPSFWIEPSIEQHVVCGTGRAVEQAREAGVPPSRVHRVSGMILRPDFYEDDPQDRAKARAALGLDASAPTGVVMFGGHGSAAMTRIAESLPDTPLILMCGHHAALARKLRAMPSRAPRAVVEFTPEVARHLRLADFFIGKPGPGSLSEAIHCGLPVIVPRNASTMPQERFNTDWVTQQGLGTVIRSFDEIGPAVQQTLARLPALQSQVRSHRNVAVFEVVEILAQFLGTAEAFAQVPHAPAADGTHAWQLPQRQDPRGHPHAMHVHREDGLHALVQPARRTRPFDPTQGPTT